MLKTAKKDEGPGLHVVQQEAQEPRHPMQWPVLDVTTTSVGRRTLIDTYRSFFQHAHYGGSFRVFVTIDPAYEVDEAELVETELFLKSLPALDARILNVQIERFERQTGLETALYVLFSHCRSEFGVHLEDDWEFFGPLDLEALVLDLVEQGAAQIVFGNTHAARGGTFERPGEVEHLEGTRVPLLRLLPASWASAYSPLCPHLHRTDQWLPTVVKALRAADPARCPDERIRDWILTRRAGSSYLVLWTKELVTRDIGRAWLRERKLHKSITIAASNKVPPGRLPVLSGAGLQFVRSEKLLVEAQRLIPGVTQTFMKRPENFAPGAFPLFLEGGEGALVYDVDGNEYIDFICGLGTLTLGHNHPAVVNTIRERVGKGVIHSLPTRPEISAAQAIASTVPNAEMVRFFKTGADACSAAVRLARYLTGKEQIISVGYHGWHDHFSTGTPGVPGALAHMVRRLPLARPEDEEALLEALQTNGQQVAALLLAIPYSYRLTSAFVGALRQACSNLQVLLVLDDVVTGFRLALGGAQEYFGVSADLICMSKGLAAGMPLAALAGSAAAMHPLAELHISTTFGGELLSLEVCKAVLQTYRESDYLQRLARHGAQLRGGINAAAAALGLPEIMLGYDAMPFLCLATEPARHAQLAEQFLGALAKRGVLLRRDVNFICGAHTQEQIEFAIEGVREALHELAAGGLLNRVGAEPA